MPPRSFHDLSDCSALESVKAPRDTSNLNKTWLGSLWLTFFKVSTKSHDLIVGSAAYAYLDVYKFNLWIHWVWQQTLMDLMKTTYISRADISCFQNQLSFSSLWILHFRPSITSLAVLEYQHLRHITRLSLFSPSCCLRYCWLPQWCRLLMPMDAGTSPSQKCDLLPCLARSP